MKHVTTLFKKHETLYNSLDELREKCNVWRLRCGAPSFWGLVLRVKTMLFKKHETRYNTLQKA